VRKQRARAGIGAPKCSRSRPFGAASDTARVTDDGEDVHGAANRARGADDGMATSRPQLQRVAGPIDGTAPPLRVTLRREFKGLTVADLLHHEIAERLPGRARSALQHLQRGDLRSAEQALPGEWAPLLQGPGHARRARRRLVLWLTAITIGACAIVAWQWF
jgi:hypothetical protein